MRKAAEIDPLELWKLFSEKYDQVEGRYDIVEIGKIGDDLKKVRFDFENTGFEPVPEFNDGFCGLRKIWCKNGYLSCIGMWAGGDWEYPVYFIIYLDQDRKTLRAYIPEEGNTYNKDTKEAIGNNDEADIKFLKKNAMIMARSILTGQEPEVDDADALYSIALMKADIKKRFEVVENVAKKGHATKG